MLIIDIFSKSIRVYEVVSSIWWYAFGSCISIMSGFGGLSLCMKNKENS
ncbi:MULTISPECIES: hypothetical protein [unclassified Clostridium]|nr:MULTISPECIES: hypothetical protein [unclassified Clostridium]